MVTIGNWIKNPSSSSSSLDKEFIAQSILKKTRSDLYLCWNSSLTTDQLKECSKALSLFEKGMPLAYVLKETQFYSSNFQIDENVFIPRIDTEVLVDIVLKKIKEPVKYFMDWGCGSGCIGLSLLKKWPKSHLISVDKNLKAISCTNKNASSFRNFSAIHKDILDLKVEDFSPISLIVSNPPYIAFEDPHVDPQVKLHEPHEALFSGPTGLECIESWLSKAVKFLSINGGNYFFEIGFDQREKVEKIIQKYPLICHFKFYKDYQNHYRVVHCVVDKKTGVK